MTIQPPLEQHCGCGGALPLALQLAGLCRSQCKVKKVAGLCRWQCMGGGANLENSPQGHLEGGGLAKGVYRLTSRIMSITSVTIVQEEVKKSPKFCVRKWLKTNAYGGGHFE